MSNEYANELAVLKTEYLRCLNEPVFDDPKKYTIILDLIQDRIDELTADEDEEDWDVDTDDEDYY